MDVPPSPRRHWPLIIAAIATTVILVIAGGGIWWRFFGGAEYWARSHWNPPHESLLTSLQKYPVPGWTVDIASLGLPAGSTFSITTSGIPGPVIKTATNRAYLIAGGPGDVPQWWLAGIDHDNGHRLFGPVDLGHMATTPHCFVNGQQVVCISDDTKQATASVIDGQNGAVVYRGPTDIRLFTWMTLVAQQSGDHLIATAKHSGLYGVGPHAETTWFVPGLGVLGMAGANFGLQGVGAEESGGTVMFGLSDGKSINAQFPADATMTNIEFVGEKFAGGFQKTSYKEFVQLFDNTGKLLSKKRIKGRLLDGTGNLFTVLNGDTVSVYDSHANRLLAFPGSLNTRSVLIGTTLWVADDAEKPQYRAIDMRTGEAAATCTIGLDSYYIGTDGVVAINAPVNDTSAVLAEAYELSTCKKLWTVPRPKGVRGRIMRLGNDLVRVSDDGTRVYSLVNR